MDYADGTFEKIGKSQTISYVVKLWCKGILCFSSSVVEIKKICKQIVSNSFASMVQWYDI